MRALGIPNNKMFYEVTKIEDALQLWKSIQVRAQRAQCTAQLVQAQSTEHGLLLSAPGQLAICAECDSTRVVQDKVKGDFKPDDEEFEDAQGNVYSKKTYEDLRRQGLI
jgi:splicing factor 3A subunit 3